MYFLYSLLLSLAFIVLLPYFALRTLVGGKSAGNLKEKLGFLALSLRSNETKEPGRSPFRSSARPTIWFHAVSVGEAIATGPLVKAVRERFPQSKLIVSTTTATGQAVARAQITSADACIYFPLDLPFSVARALDHLKPDLVVLIESELWPNFLKAAQKRGIKTIVANGRISDRTFARLSSIKLVANFLYRNVSLFAMQTEEDKERAEKLGASRDQVIVAGNLKYDVSPPAAQDTTWEGINGRPLIIAGSTAEGEDEIVIEAYKEFVAQNPLYANTRLLLAPRHPARFESVASLIASSGLEFERRSSSGPAGNAPVLLLDSVGELASLYRCADVVFVGGSLVPAGGHNILEPAAFARPIIVGPFMNNFRAITNDFLSRDALVQLLSSEKAAQTRELASAFERLFTNPGSAREIGENALRTVESNRGATRRHVEAIAGLLTSA